MDKGRRVWGDPIDGAAIGVAQQGSGAWRFCGGNHRGAASGGQRFGDIVGLRVEWFTGQLSRGG